MTDILFWHALLYLTANVVDGISVLEVLGGEVHLLAVGAVDRRSDLRQRESVVGKLTKHVGGQLLVDTKVIEGGSQHVDVLVSLSNNDAVLSVPPHAKASDDFVLVGDGDGFPVGRPLDRLELLLCQLVPLLGVWVVVDQRVVRLVAYTANVL